MRRLIVGLAAVVVFGGVEQRDGLAAMVYWADKLNGTDAIFRADLDAQDPFATIEKIVTDVRARDVLVDPVNRKLYWATDGGDISTISRGNLDGSDPETLLVGRWPRRLAIDTDEGYLYWTAYVASRRQGWISRAGLDGSDPVNFAGGLDNLYTGIDVNPISRHFYFRSANQLRIWRGTLDSPRVYEVVAGQVTNEVGPIKLDVESGYLFWYHSGKIWRIDTNNIDSGGGGASIVVNSFGSGFDGLTLDTTDRKLYWVSQNTIHRSDLDGSNPEEVLALGGMAPDSDPQAIAIYNPIPELSTFPSTLDFSLIRVGTTGTESLAVTNTGDVGSTLSGSFPAASGEFGPGSTSGFGALGWEESDNRQYTNTPTDHGSDTQGITITSDGGDSNITLSGTGVGPVFDSDLAPGSPLDFDIVELGVSESFFLDVSNITTEANGGDATLTDLTLLDVQIAGEDAGLFDIIGFTSGTVLHKDDILSLELGYNGTGTLGMKNATLTVFTDDDAALGANGLHFSYGINANVVPEPSTLVLLLMGAFALLAYPRYRRRR